MQVQMDVLCERHLGGRGGGSSQQDSAWAVYALHCALWVIGKDSRHDPLYQQEFTIPLDISLLPGDIPPPVRFQDKAEGTPEHQAGWHLGEHSGRWPCLLRAQAFRGEDRCVMNPTESPRRSVFTIKD